MSTSAFCTADESGNFSQPSSVPKGTPPELIHQTYEIDRCVEWAKSLGLSKVTPALHPWNEVKR